MKQSELTPLAVLREAKCRIVEIGWCQGASARDRDGIPVIESRMPPAAYCLRRALGPNGFGVVEFEAQDLLIRALNLDPLNQFDRVGGIVSWNDATGRTREQVVAALDKAIALAEARA